MRKLPVGIQSFERLINGKYLYVDKTGILVNLISKGEHYFLSRPRRFGKSLTLSTLEAMFSGEYELFIGLSAEKWVQDCSKNPFPVFRFDISNCESENVSLFKQSLKDMLYRFARRFNVELHSKTIKGMFQDLIEEVYKTRGHIVILIDEYDKPILDNIGNIKKAEKLRDVLRSFYSVLKSYDNRFRFVFLTGISKFSKVGVFSALNNLLDISLINTYSDIVGYTQDELENNFVEWISFTAEKMNLYRSEILRRLMEYYDGFSFDGVTKLYNPYSILSFFASGEFNNYWYESGSPSFIVEWMKAHHIQEPDEYRHKVVKNNFVDSEEIERADPSSFLFQSGYLTVESKEGQLLTLDYPNREVRDSISSMYLKLIYKVESYAMLGNEIWKALRVGDMSEVVKLYNVALSGVAYDDYSLNRNEFWYRSMFVMLLRGAGIISYSEPHTSLGRADVVINFQDKIIVLEFKFAEKSSDIEKMKIEGEQQIKDRHYAQSYDFSDREIITAVIVADDEKRRATL